MGPAAGLGKGTAMMEFSQRTMLDFGTRKRPIPTFSLDRKDQVRRSHMRRREWRAVIMLPVAIIVLGLFIRFLLDMKNDLGAIAEHQPLVGPQVLLPMARPDLAKAGALPSIADQQAQGEAVRHLLADPDAVPVDISGPDATGMAWARAQLNEDLKAPPIPQHLLARDLVLGSAGPGTPCLLSGRLEDAIQTGETPAPSAPPAASKMPAPTSKRLLIALDEKQWLEVVLPLEQVLEPDAHRPSDDLVIGAQVSVVGRVLGKDQLTTANGQVTVPVVAARLVRPAAGDDDAELQLGHAWSQPGSFVLPQDIWKELSDEHTYVETRPYYFALGQERLESTLPASSATPFDLNHHAGDVHQDPEKYRNQAMTVLGKVYSSWEDWQVAQDKPFGVQRVVRALLYHTDFGPVTETLESGTTVTHNRLVLCLYEVAMVTDQPLPEHDSQIIVDGHFLKFHAIPVKPDPQRDHAHHLERQSANDYAYFLVTGPYRVVPPPAMYDFRVLNIAVVATTIVLVITFWRLSRGEKLAEASVAQQVRKLRLGRLKLRGRVSAGEATGSGAPERAAPATPAPPSPASGEPGGAQTGDAASRGPDPG